MRQNDIYTNLAQLGSLTALTQPPEEAVVERVASTCRGVLPAALAASGGMIPERPTAPLRWWRSQGPDLPPSPQS
jgi:hypothetical protein